MKKVLFAVAAAILLGQSAWAAAFDLQITEMWAGQNGADLTEDWFELTNVGDLPWVSGTDPVLHYDDDPFDPGRAADITGINDIQPNESVIVLVNANETTDITDFLAVWGADLDLTGVEVGTTGIATIFNDGKSPGGLGSVGDGIIIWLGNPNDAGTVPADFKLYPALPSGTSYDVVLGAISAPGNLSGAIQTTATAGSSGLEPAIGSPGTIAIVPEPSTVALALFGFASMIGMRRRRG